MKDYNYKNFWEFLKATPRNLFSALLITSMSIIFIVSAIITRDEFDPYWTLYLVLGFMILVSFLGWLRVWLIYKRLQKLNDKNLKK